jgi:VWFA-related protein
MRFRSGVLAWAVGIVLVLVLGVALCAENEEPASNNPGLNSAQNSSMTGQDSTKPAQNATPPAGNATPQSGQSAGAVAQSESSTVRTTSTLVVVDVVVSDGGKPMKGLPRGEFHVFENGREQAIKIFEEHIAADPSKVQKLPPLPPNTYSNFPETAVTSAANVLLLDALNTPMKDQMYVRKQMLDYLKNIPVNAPMAIFTLASRLRIVQGFTADRTALLAALNDKRNAATRLSVLPDPNDTTETALNNGMQEVGASGSAIASLQQFLADQQAFQTDLRVEMTLDALKQLAAYLAGVPGRKTMIWFSGSFPVNLDPDSSLSNEFSVMRDYTGQLKETDDLLTASRVAVYPVDARGLFGEPMFNVSNANANYSGVSHGMSTPVGGGGPGAGPRARMNPNRGNGSNPNGFAKDRNKFVQTTAAEHATMEQIAQETGGQAYYDTNGIKDAMGNAIENGENYYTLAYVPDDSKFDGKFRRIQVKLADENHERLAYRSGYFADAPEASSAYVRLAPSAAAMQRGAPSSSQILFKVRVLASDDPALKGLAPQAGPAGLMAQKLPKPVKRYWIDYAADMQQVDVSLGPDGLYHCSIEFVALAYDRDGKLLNVASRAFKLNLQAAQYRRIMQSGLPMHQELDVPAGEIYLRLGVHDLATGRIGGVEIPLEVSSSRASER